MFTNTLTVELNAYSLAQDLTGVKQVIDAIEPLAQRCPGWVPFRFLAEGHFQRLRGNPTAALAAYERCIALNEDDPAEPWRSIATWPRATASAIDALIDLGRTEQARELGERALARGREREIGVAMHDVERALALAEAKLGDYASAAERLERVIGEQRQIGISGLSLGASYEARARIAIWAGDRAAVEEYGRLTAQEYRHGRGSPLGALYERLMDDARRAGVQVLPELSEFETTMMSATKIGRLTSRAAVTRSLRDARNPAERAATAIRTICEARGARGGHLYLLGEDGLDLTASHACPRPDDALRNFLEIHLATELKPEMATAIVTEAVGPSATTPQSFTDPRGVVHVPLLLVCTTDRGELCAGVAALIHDGPQSPAGGAADIVAGTAAQLIEAGDAQPCAVDGVTQVFARRGPSAV
jgi:tetratricopeptide (TPR) repeat protein